MMCKKCGAMVEDKKPMEGGGTDAMAKDAVLTDLLKMLEGSVGDKLGKPEAVSLEVISSKEDEDEEEEEA